jgi:hypothetical protein
MRRCSHLMAAACLAVAPCLAAQAAPPAAADSAHAALVRTMKDDLRRLVKAQDAYLARHQEYATSLPGSEFAPADGHLVTIVSTGTLGWTGTVTAAQEPGLTCGLYVGNGVAPNGAVIQAREPACWRPLPDGSLSAE